MRSREKIPDFFCLLDVIFSLFHKCQELNSLGGSSLLKVKWKLRQNWCRCFCFKFCLWHIIISNEVIWCPHSKFSNSPFPHSPTEAGCNWFELPLVVREEFFRRKSIMFLAVCWALLYLAVLVFYIPMVLCCFGMLSFFKIILHFLLFLVYEKSN